MGIQQKIENPRDLEFAPLTERAREKGCEIVACFTETRTLFGIPHGTPKYRVVIADPNGCEFSVRFEKQDWRASTQYFAAAALAAGAALSSFPIIPVTPHRQPSPLNP